MTTCTEYWDTQEFLACPGTGSTQSEQPSHTRMLHKSDLCVEHALRALCDKHPLTIAEYIDHYVQSLAASLPLMHTHTDLNLRVDTYMLTSLRTSLLDASIPSSPKIDPQ